MSVKGVLLDLDGTLVDTAPDLVAVLNTILGDRRLPPVPFAIARNEVSNGALGLIRLAFDGAGSESIEGLRQEFLEIYTRQVCIYSRIFSGLDVNSLNCSLFLNTSMAIYTASLNELWSAFPWPAISKAVPWSGDVRTWLRPAVKFTPLPNERVLNGINPWSW